jgi:hypothetical protein
VADLRVVVNVNDPGIRDGIVFGLICTDVIAVDDGVYAMAVD